jgi:hypothetical protein
MLRWTHVSWSLKIRAVKLYFSNLRINCGKTFCQVYKYMYAVIGSEDDILASKHVTHISKYMLCWPRSIFVFQNYFRRGCNSKNPPRNFGNLLITTTFRKIPNHKGIVSCFLWVEVTGAPELLIRLHRIARLSICELHLCTS